MKKRGIALLLCACLGLTGIMGTVKVQAAGSEESSSFQGENSDALEYVTGVDEEGNVYEVSDTEETEIIGRNPLTLAAEGQLVNFRTKSSSSLVTNYTDAVTGNAGYTNGYYGADAAYLGMENGMVKFMLSGVTGLVSPSEVTIVSIDEAGSISHYEVDSSGRLIHRITTNMSGSAYASNPDNGDAPSYLQSGVNYYSYDGHYFYTYDNFNNMLSDYRAGTREHSVNPENPYFNYFQYLPLRSISDYSASELNSAVNSRVPDSSKLRDAGQLIVQAQDWYGTNALLIAGIAANESAWGMSNIAQTKNNLFGINAVDSSPGQSANTFPSVAACIEEYTQYFLSEQYLNPDNWKYSGGFLGNKASGMNVRYASDPYWGEKAAAIAWSLDRSNGNQDAYTYTIGVKDVLPEQTDLNVRVQATTASNAVYSTGAWPCVSFIVLDSAPVSGFYRVQSDPALTEDRSSISDAGNYNYKTMYLYASASYIDIVSQGSGTLPEISGVSFTDVPLGAWFYDYVKYVDDAGIMTGLNWYTFEPGESLYRAQFALILYRLAGEPEVEYSNTFHDVADGVWYTDAILWANSVGVVTGYSNGNFGPGDTLNREQMVTMLYRYAQYMGYDTSASGNMEAFPDVSQVSDFAENAMRWAIGTNIISGDNGRLNPQNTVVRAVGATIMTRYMGINE